MQIRGDVESVNLKTGERFQRVTGNGDSRLESLGRHLTREEREGIRAFERHMQNVIIPEVVETIKKREAAYEKIKHIPLFS